MIKCDKFIELVQAITFTFVHGFQNNLAKVFSLKCRSAIRDICLRTFTNHIPRSPLHPLLPPDFFYALNFEEVEGGASCFGPVRLSVIPFVVVKLENSLSWEFEILYVASVQKISKHIFSVGPSLARLCPLCRLCAIKAVAAPPPPSNTQKISCCFLCPRRNFGWHIKIAPSVRLSVRPSVTNRASALSHKLLKQI